MKNKIALNDKIAIDLIRLIASKLFIYANSGFGKSWLLRRILENSFGKIQQIVIDTEGEFATLREKYDYVLIGKGLEIAADPRTAGLLAHRLLQENVSAIIDLYELDPKDRERFVENFTNALTNAPKNLWHPCLVVYDEAQEYAPERPQSGGTVACAEAMIRFAKKARKRGFCPVYATQRISDISKSLIATCNNKLIGQASLDIDMKRCAAELGFSSKEQMLSLRDLDPGEFFAFGPALTKDVVQLRIGGVQTSHPDSSKIGSRIGTKVVPPSEKVKKALAKLADLPKEAAEEAKNIADLRKENGLLKSQLKDAARQPNLDLKAIDRAVAEAVTRRDMDWREVMEAWEKYAASMIDTIRNNLNSIFRAEQPKKSPVIVAYSSITKEKVKQLTDAIEQSIRPGTEYRVTPAMRRTTYEALRPIPPGATIIPTSTEYHKAVSKSQQKILDSLAWLESLKITPADKKQVAFLSDQRSTSGGYFGNLGSLRNTGFITYPSPGVVELTAEGRSIANAPETPPSNAELHRQIREKLGSSQWNILEVLIGIYPEEVSKSDLAMRVNQKETSGGYFGNLGLLRTLGLIDYPRPGYVVATKILFVE